MSKTILLAASSLTALAAAISAPVRAQGTGTTGNAAGGLTNFKKAQNGTAVCSS